MNCHATSIFIILYNEGATNIFHKYVFVIELCI